MAQETSASSCACFRAIAAVGAAPRHPRCSCSQWSQRLSNRPRHAHHPSMRPRSVHLPQGPSHTLAGPHPAVCSPEASRAEAMETAVFGTAGRPTAKVALEFKGLFRCVDCIHVPDCDNVGFLSSRAASMAMLREATARHRTSALVLNAAVLRTCWDVLRRHCARSVLAQMCSLLLETRGDKKKPSRRTTNDACTSSSRHEQQVSDTHVSLQLADGVSTSPPSPHGVVEDTLNAAHRQPGRAVCPRGCGAFARLRTQRWCRRRGGRAVLAARPVVLGAGCWVLGAELACSGAEP